MAARDTKIELLLSDAPLLEVFRKWIKARRADELLDCWCALHPHRLRGRRAAETHRWTPTARLALAKYRGLQTASERVEHAAFIFKEFLDANGPRSLSPDDELLQRIKKQLSEVRGLSVTIPLSLTLSLPVRRRRSFSRSSLPSCGR